MMFLKTGSTQSLRRLLPALATGLALTAALGTTGSWAESPGMQPQQQQQLSPEQAEQVQKFQQLQAELQGLQKQLTAIQEKTLESNPELVEQQEAFEQLVREEMQASGLQPDQDVEQIQALQEKIKDSSLPEQERRGHYQQYRQAVMEFQQAQQQVMEKEAVQSAREELNQAMLTAMKSEDPKTEALLSDMRQTQEQMVEIRNSVMPGQQ